jgi:hypothetical protein
VSNGKCTSLQKNDLDKEIIFDLGKMQTMLNSRELNVSNLTSGVYIIKINEKTLQLLEN